jgi:hypothetical protein
MADLFVKLFRIDKAYRRPMVHITIEPEPGGPEYDDAHMAFQTAHGFAFVVRAEDAARLASEVHRVLVTDLLQPAAEAYACPTRPSPSEKRRESHPRLKLPKRQTRKKVVRRGGNAR